MYGQHGCQIKPFNKSLCNKLVVKTLTQCNFDYCFHFHRLNSLRLWHNFSLWGKNNGKRVYEEAYNSKASTSCQKKCGQ